MQARSAGDGEGLVEAAKLIRSGRVTATELTQRTLQRIAELDGTYKSYLHISAHAVEQASIADAELQRGVDRGPLHGIPIAVKDLCDTSFAPTTAGTTIFAGRIPDANATVVARLVEAGAVVLGKLTMTEGAFASHHPSIPTPLNPWGHDLWVGPSSTGSGVATAARLCYGAIGTDTGGSIRFPSATCGLTGVKPTWGRVSRKGVFPLAESLDHVGPMARSVEDCAAILGATAGWDEGDPTSLPAVVPDYLEELRRPLSGFTIGLDVAFAYDGVEPEVANALEAALGWLVELGATTVAVKVPPCEHLAAEWAAMCSAETAAAHGSTYPSRASEYGPALAALIEQGLSMGSAEIEALNRARRDFTGELEAMLAGVDALLIPTIPFAIPTLERMGGRDAPRVTDLLRYTAPFDVSGSPTLTLPNGLDRRGLPLSMQLVGRRLSEAMLMRIGHAYQANTDWHRRTPLALAGTAEPQGEGGALSDATS